MRSFGVPFVLAIALALALMGPPAARPATPLIRMTTARVQDLSIARLDQWSRYAFVSVARPAGRVELYANGFLVGYGYPRTHVVRVALSRQLRPGERIAAAQRFAATSRPLFGRAPIIVQADYTTYHFDNDRSGWNPFETTLTTTNVKTTAFGALFTIPLDGDMMAQPLYMGGLSMGALGVHDVLFAVTEADTVYAVDADNGAVLWSESLVNPAGGLTAVPTADVGKCKDIAPTVGITSTPVIDPATNTMYVVAKSELDQNGQKSWYQTLHALDITTGAEAPGSPVDIAASLLTSGGQITFNPRWQLNRPGLLLSGGMVYVGFGSHCDLRGLDSRGWVFAYDESTLQQIGAYVTTDDSVEGFGSFWQSGYGLAADGSGSVYGVTGNGAFDGSTSFGNSVLRFGPKLALLDEFTPYDYQTLDASDVDLGSGGAMVLPIQSGPYPKLLVAAGKSRTLYLLNRDALGGFTPGGPDNVLQEIPGAVGANLGVWGGPAYYAASNNQQFIYYCGGQDVMKAFSLSASQPMLLLAGQTTRKFTGEGGTIPVISSNGSTSGSAILWAVNRPTKLDRSVKLFAFDATHLSRRLFSAVAGVYDNPAGGFFSVPTVINGKVYVSAGTSIAVYGLH